MVRQIILDTETTGLDPAKGHRIIEIGCLELVDRRLTGNNLHYYLNPERAIDQGAVQVHGITQEFLADKPIFTDIIAEFIEFVSQAELIIHNAPFDLGFINAELKKAKHKKTIESYCTVLDTLMLARKNYPGQRNSLDALCKRLKVDNSNRKYHGALLDAELLAEVYLKMTGGQVAMNLAAETSQKATDNNNLLNNYQKLSIEIPVIYPTHEELAANSEFVNL